MNGPIDRQHVANRSQEKHTVAGYKHRPSPPLPYFTIMQHATSAQQLFRVAAG